MANNRLYLYDPETGDGVMIARGHGDGWCVYPELMLRLDEFFERLHENAPDGASFGISDSPTKLALIAENDPRFDSIRTTRPSPKTD